jgi:FMN-dependent oxidoreductase (nitrilotriacetate monooxygenase family)
MAPRPPSLDFPDSWHTGIGLMAASMQLIITTTWSTDMTDNPFPYRRRDQMLLGMQLANYGSAEAAWRWPAANPRAFLNLDALAESAQWAERGLMQVLFITDHPSMREDLTSSVPGASIDPIVLATHIVAKTERIGVAFTQSTTWNYPYNVARQLKALDVVSGGRIGWNAVTTNDPRTAANYGGSVPDREERYARAHEFIQIVQALWGSFPEDALRLDTKQGIFADGARIQPINLAGRYLASRGPLPIPASPQGQPILFQAGGGIEGMQLAGEYASGVYSMAVDVPTGRALRAGLADAARAAGRQPHEINLFMGIMTTVADTEEEALERRHQLMQMVAHTLPEKLDHLSAVVNVPVQPHNAHRPLTASQIAALRAAPNQMHADRAVAMLQEGRTPYEAILRGVLEFHRVVMGSPEQVADELQELFLEGAADGFLLIPDVLADGLPAFVEKVVPILQERGLYHTGYEGSTLREHFGVEHQYGRRDQ